MEIVWKCRFVVKDHQRKREKNKSSETLCAEKWS